MTATRPHATSPHRPAPPGPSRTGLRPSPPIRDDAHLDTLSRSLREMLPAFAARDPARGRRDRILPIAEGLLRGREALREGPHGRLRARRHLLAAILHAAHLAFDGDDPLTPLLTLQHRRLTRRQRTDRHPWLDAPPTRHYDRALTQAVSLSYELDRRDGPSPRRLQNQAADLANHILYYLIQTDALAVPALRRGDAMCEADHVESGEGRPNR